MCLELLRAAVTSGLLVSLAIAGTLFAGVCPIIAVVKALQLSFNEYLRHSVIPAFGVVTGPALLLAVVVSFHQPNNWLLFVSYAAVFSVNVIALAYFVFRKSNPQPAQIDQINSNLTGLESQMENGSN